MNERKGKERLVGVYGCAVCLWLALMSWSLHECILFVGLISSIQRQVAHNILFKPKSYTCVHELE